MHRMKFKQQGFSLLEVLITVLILSIGLLGLAGMQLSGLKKNQSAYLRSQSTYLSYDIADRMRANQTATLNGDYNINMSDSIPAAGSIAATDLNEWLTALQNTLPNGDGSIAVNGNVVTITTQWSETRFTDEVPTDIETFELTTRI